MPASAFILQHDLVECNGSRGLFGSVVEFLLKRSPFLKSQIEFLLGLCNAVLVGMKFFGLGVAFVVLDGGANVEDKVVGEGLDRRGSSGDNVLVGDGEVLELELSLLLLLGCLLLLESRSLGVGGGGGVEGGIGARVLDTLLVKDVPLVGVEADLATLLERLVVAQFVPHSEGDFLFMFMDKRSEV